MLSRKVRIAVLVSGGGTNLQALIDAQESGIIKSGQIVAVISSNKDTYALECHVDTEEGNAAGAKNGMICQMIR